VSHDPICGFAAQETLSQLETVELRNTFVETVIFFFFQDSEQKVITVHMCLNGSVYISDI